MIGKTRTASAYRLCQTFALLFATACILAPRVGTAQGLTGALIGTVQDEQGGALLGARVRISSPAMIGGPVIFITKADGQWYFPALSPGVYVLDVEVKGFAALHQENIVVRAGATVDRPVILALEGLTTTVVVKETGSLDARASGLDTHFGPEDLGMIPTRRTGQIDYIRATPGISPTSPAGGVTVSGVATTFSSFGSGTNENQFLFDGTNFTCPCNGMARADPGVDFIREVHVQSIGASAEYGNVQGAVVNVILKQGSNRLLFDAAYYAQTPGLTSQPVRLLIPRSTLESGYHRTRYRDVTSSLGGPVVRDHLWFFGGYQALRDADSQPGTPAESPRTLDQDKVFGKLTWKLGSRWQLTQSFHDEFQRIRDQPTIILPVEATLHRKASVPAVIFGNLTHTASANTVWNVHVGRFVFSQESTPSTGDWTKANRIDNATNIQSGAPQQFTVLTISRTTAKATVSHYLVGLLGANHELKVGGQVERAGHHAIHVVPTGQRFTDRNGQPVERLSVDPDHVGGRADTASVFASDTLRLGNRFTINAGVRFDHSRAISQDLPAVDLAGRETGATVSGLGTLYTWNVWSPRLGVSTQLGADGRTILRASYGRFSQGVLTGELEPFHPGATIETREAFEPATGDYTRLVERVDPKELRLNPEMRPPHTDEFSVGVDREVGRQLALTIAYVRKEGRDFIGWIDVGGQYDETTATLADGRSMSVFKLVNKPTDRRYYLTNPEGYSLNYNGLVAVVERRRSRGWQAAGSYTFSKTSGLQPSSGGTAAGAQVSTVSPPQPATFGQDPNDLINARGRMLNDRPHMFRFTGSVDIPRVGFVVSASLQALSGKPWAATALINPQFSSQRVLIEPRGSRRLSSPTLLDLRVSRTIALGGMGQAELLFDVLNALNDTAEQGIASDVLVNSNFGRATTFMDPRRAMLGVRFRLGR